MAQVRRVRIPIAQASIKISSNVDAMDIDSPLIIPVSKLQLKNNGATSFTLQSIPSTGRKRVRFAWQIALMCYGLYTAQVNAHLTNFLETSVYGASGSN